MRGNLENDIVVDNTDNERLLPQFLTTVIVSMLSLMVGYSAAFSSPAELSITTDLNATKTEISWIGSLLPVGAVIGSVTGGPVMEFLGRKWTLIITNILFLIGWTAIHFSYAFWLIYLGRVICGYAVGLVSFALPVYVTEIVHHKIRGRFGLLPTLFGNFGILLCYGVGTALEWRGLSIVAVGLTIPFFLTLWYIPETPHWLIHRQRIDRAKKSLHFLRGSRYDITAELELLLNPLVPEHKSLFARSHIKASLIVLSLMFFQQFSGVNAVIYYTTDIFRQSESSINAYVSTAIVGGVNFLSTFIATTVVDYLGRKVLMYISNGLMFIALTVLSVYFYLLEVEKSDMTNYSWIPLTVLVIYVLGFSFGMGPVPWLMMSELLPAAVRGQAASFAAAFNWICTFIITFSFPLLVKLLGAYTMFLFFLLIVIATVIFVKFLVPETKKRTLQEIEAGLARGSTNAPT